jgi:hypothetical protein
MIKPAYRRGPGFRKGTLRLSLAVWEALAAEAARRRRWVSDVAQQLLAEGLGRVDRAAQPEAPPPPAGGGKSRRTCHLAIDASVWEALHAEARREGLSVAQLIRQRLAELVAQAPPSPRPPSGHHPSSGTSVTSSPRAPKAVLDTDNARETALAPPRDADQSETGDRVPNVRGTPQPLTVFEW